SPPPASRRTGISVAGAHRRNRLSSSRPSGRPRACKCFLRRCRACSFLASVFLALSLKSLDLCTALSARRTPVVGTLRPLIDSTCPGIGSLASVTDHQRPRVGNGTCQLQCQ